MQPHRPKQKSSQPHLPITTYLLKRFYFLTQNKNYLKLSNFFLVYINFYKLFMAFLILWSQIFALFLRTYHVLFLDHFALNSIIILSPLYIVVIFIWLSLALICSLFEGRNCSFTFIVITPGIQYCNTQWYLKKLLSKLIFKFAQYLPFNYYMLFQLFHINKGKGMWA